MGEVIELNATIPTIRVERIRLDFGPIVELIFCGDCLVWATGDNGTVEDAIAAWRADEVRVVDHRGEV